MSISIRLHTHVEGMDSIEVLAWSLERELSKTCPQEI